MHSWRGALHHRRELTVKGAVELSTLGASLGAEPLCGPPQPGFVGLGPFCLEGVGGGGNTEKAKQKVSGVTLQGDPSN